ncbi:MAG: Crp/Fnr family transcriptional regulator [Alphaproteobacteria bacterium]|nr:MAG: Crp/Fnr family transcriptional regulator [Alphaproteobacteria bacterium]
MRENENSTFSWLVISGMLARFGQTTAGLRQFTTFHVHGEMADLHSAVRPIGVGGLTALCDTSLLRVPHEALRKLAARLPAVAEALWRDCTLDSAILMEWVVNVGRRDASTRLAHLLCEMAIRSSGYREILLSYDFPVTQEQLADATGMTSVHVNRSLRQLREEGLVSVCRGTVQIHDWNALAARGDFDPYYLTADTLPERQRRLLAA